MSRRIDRALLRRVGRPILWEQAILRTSKRYDGSVPFFAGEPEDRGYHYSPPKKLKALLTSDNRRQAFDVEGAWESGRAMMTFDAALDIGPQDRITFLDLPVRQELELQRGAGSTDEVPDDLSVVSLLAVRDDGRVYILGQDYQLQFTRDPVTEENLVAGIDWSPSQDPPAASSGYGLLVKIRPVWIVQGPPMIRALGPGKRNQLPKRANLVRDDRRIRS